MFEGLLLPPRPTVGARSSLGSAQSILGDAPPQSGPGFAAGHGASTSSLQHLAPELAALFSPPPAQRQGLRTSALLDELHYRGEGVDEDDGSKEHDNQSDTDTDDDDIMLLQQARLPTKDPAPSLVVQHAPLSPPGAIPGPDTLPPALSDESAAAARATTTTIAATTTTAAMLPPMIALAPTPFDASSFISPPPSPLINRLARSQPHATNAMGRVGDALARLLHSQRHPGASRDAFASPSSPRSPLKVPTARVFGHVAESPETRSPRVAPPTHLASARRRLEYALGFVDEASASSSALTPTRTAPQPSPFDFPVSTAVDDVDDAEFLFPSPASHRRHKHRDHSARALRGRKANRARRGVPTHRRHRRNSVDSVAAASLLPPVGTKRSRSIAFKSDASTSDGDMERDSPPVKRPSLYRQFLELSQSPHRGRTRRSSSSTGSLTPSPTRPFDTDTSPQRGHEQSPSTPSPSSITRSPRRHFASPRRPAPGVPEYLQRRRTSHRVFDILATTQGTMATTAETTTTVETTTTTTAISDSTTTSSSSSSSDDNGGFSSTAVVLVEPLVLDGVSPLVTDTAEPDSPRAKTMSLSSLFRLIGHAGRKRRTRACQPPPPHQSPPPPPSSPPPQDEEK